MTTFGANNLVESDPYGIRTTGMGDEFSRVMQALDTENAFRAEELLPFVYDELRRLAAIRLGDERSGQTLQATALVHDAWILLAGGEARTWNDRAHFFRAASRAMRRILVDRARRKLADKRGGGARPMNLEDFDVAASDGDDRIVVVDEVLERLEEEDPEGARVVTMKFFVGLSESEIGEILGVSERTVRRQWAYAKTRLFQLILETQ